MIRADKKPPPDPAAEAAKLVETMDRCVREKGGLSYYVSPSMQPGGGLAGYDRSSATITYNPAGLARQTPYVAAYYVAGTFAAHIASLERKRFGQGAIAAAWGDYIVGFLTHCAYDEQVLPRASFNDDPRFQFSDFLYVQGGRVPLSPATQARVNEFNSGWWEFGAGFPPEMRH
ncbi:MAG: hypothetical protein ABI624_20850 [Casimicrobiaceae bacterium]